MTATEQITPILNFIRSRPAIGVRSLEREMNEEHGFPINTLSNTLSEAVDKRFPDKWIWPLCVTLSRYGLEIDGHRFRYHDDTHGFTLEAFDGDEPVRQYIDSQAELDDFLNKC